MEKLVIEGGHRLDGEIQISGSKNAALPILLAAILCEGKCRFSGVPNLRDITTTIDLLTMLGCKASREENGDIITSTDNLVSEAPYELVRTMRASVLCLGPLLARTGKARVALPGGCAIGSRPVDLHLRALSEMGASFVLEEGYILGKCERLHGARIVFDFPTVGGTENLLMAASLAEGKTILENAAKEPEIVDLANFLCTCGAKIEGQGTSTIVIHGVKYLSGQPYKVMSDRIEAGTYMIAAALCRGNLFLRDCPSECLKAVISKLRQFGAEVEIQDDGLVVRASERLKAADVRTEPYPGFPTDMQAQFMALACVANGSSVVQENIFENRFMHAPELVRMGAKIKIVENTAVVQGVERLKGAPVMASDLRASASLVLAGLGAEGKTEVLRIYHLDRGYENIEQKLSGVGASITRVRDKND